MPFNYGSLPTCCNPWRMASRPRRQRRLDLRDRQIPEAGVVQDRHDRAQREFLGLEREAQAWKDPVYRERMRRQLEAADR